MHRAPSVVLRRSFFMLVVFSTLAFQDERAEQSAGYEPPPQPFFRQVKNDFYVQHPNLLKADKLTQTEPESGADWPIDIARKIFLLQNLSMFVLWRFPERYREPVATAICSLPMIV